MKARPQRNEKGQALILILLAVAGLIGLTALAVDGGHVFATQRQARNAADTAAFAAALAQIDGADYNAAALSRASSNNFPDDTNSAAEDPGQAIDVIVNYPPVADSTGTPSAYIGDPDYIQVIIQAHVPTFFAPLIGVQSLPIRVQAVTKAKLSGPAPSAFGNGLVALKPHGCDVVWSHGNPDTVVEGAGVFDNSDDPNCALRQNGAGSITADAFNLVGGADYSAGHLIGTIVPAQQVPYPPIINWPDPASECTGNAPPPSGGVLSPGRVTGGFPPGGVDTLEPGVYCVNGGFDLHGNGSLTGHGVTIYLESGGVTWNGNYTIDLSAPTSGDFAGLLLYLPMTNDSRVTLNGTSDSHFTGTILAPASEVRLLGTGDSESNHGQVIGYTIELGGNSTLHMFYDADENFTFTVPPETELNR